MGDVSDLEEYLVQLGKLEAEIREQCKRLSMSDPELIAYEKLWPDDEDD